jgi:hypothetical protein
MSLLFLSRNSPGSRCNWSKNDWDCCCDLELVEIQVHLGVIAGVAESAVHNEELISRSACVALDEELVDEGRPL